MSLVPTSVPTSVPSATVSSRSHVRGFVVWFFLGGFWGGVVSRPSLYHRDNRPRGRGCFRRVCLDRRHSDHFTDHQRRAHQPRQRLCADPRERRDLPPDLLRRSVFLAWAGLFWPLLTNDSASCRHIQNTTCTMPNHALLCDRVTHMLHMLLGARHPMVCHPIHAFQAVPVL